MAFATTTLSSAVLTTDTSIVVASAASFAAGRLLIVDQELMQVTQGYSSGTTIPVLRGRDGTVTSAHAKTANVTHGLASDFASPGAESNITYPTIRPVIVTSVTTTPSTLTFAPSGCDQRVILNGTAAITLTIPVPTKDMDGQEISFVSNGVAAHLLTFTGGLSGAGSSYDVVTINATAPAAFKVIACNGLWMCFCGPAMGGTVTNLIGSVA